MAADIQGAVERQKKVEEIVRDHFYPGPVAGSTARLTKALDEYISAALAEANEARSILQQAVLDRAAERDEANRQIAERDEALKGFDDDFMTSETHHPGYVLIPTAVFERVRALLSTEPAGGGEKADEGPCAICSDPDDDGPCPEHRPAPATAALATNPDNPPEGFRRLPAGVRCRCIRLWRGASGDHYCCRPGHEQGEG